VYYLATAVPLVPQFLHGADTQQYEIKDHLILQIKPIGTSEGIIFHGEYGSESFGTAERFDPAVTLL
jgi:hypothetical protein